MMKKFITLAAAMAVLLSISSCRNTDEILEVPEIKSSISAKKINDSIEFKEYETHSQSGQASDPPRKKDEIRW